jgi:uncharacterized protein YjbJ (UPF0337 family)
MQNDVEKPDADDAEAENDRRLSGFSQFIVGELETIGGVLMGDPLTQAEGEFNVEVGTVREGIEDELDERSDREESE